MRCYLAVFLAAAAAVSLAGCARARIVETSQDGGVVAIPANTNRWPNYYRRQAEKLIHEKCPEGYEIVEEEEYVTGQVAHTQARTKTRQSPRLDLGHFTGDNEKMEDGEASLAGLSIPLGSTREDTDATTQYRDVTEYRIRFRPRTSDEAKSE